MVLVDDVIAAVYVGLHTGNVERLAGVVVLERRGRLGCQHDIDAAIRIGSFLWRLVGPLSTYYGYRDRIDVGCAHQSSFTIRQPEFVSRQRWDYH